MTTRSTALVAASPRRAEIEATLAEGGYARPGRRARAGAWRWPTPSPPSTSSSSSPTPRPSCRRAPRRGRVLRAVGAGEPRRLHRRAVPHPAHLRLGPLRRRPHRGRLPEADARHRRSTARRSSGWRPRRRPGHGRGPARPRRLGPPPRWTGRRRDPACRSRRRPASPSRATTRRRSTWPSGSTPTSRRSRRPRRSRDALRRSCRASSGTATPTAPPPSCGAAIGALHGVAAEQVFVANGSNEVIQTVCLAFAGPAGRWSRSSPPTPARPDRPHHRQPRWSRPSGAATSCWSSPRSTPALADGRSRRAFVCSPNNPTGWSSRATSVEHLVAAGAGPASSSTRPTPSSRRGRRCDLVAEDRPAGRHPHLLQDVVDGGRPARLPDRPGVARRASSTRSCCRTTSTPSSSSPGASPSASPTRWSRGCGARGGAGPPRRPRCSTWTSTCGRATPTSCCSGPADRAGRRRVAGSGRPVRAGARLLLVAAPRRLPAGHRRHAGRERPLPRRARRGAATREDRVTADRGPQRATAETAIDARPSTSTARAHRVDTGLPFFDHMLHQLGRHGGFDLDRQAEGDLESTPTTRSRTSASRSARRSGEALGDKAGVRRFASGPCPLDEAAGRGRPRPVRPPVPALRGGAARGEGPRRPAVRPPAGRGVLAGVRHGRRHHPARTSACGAATPTTSSRPASRAWPASCATPSASRAAACRPPRARCDGGRPLIAVLDYGIGNLRSAQKALEHVGADARLTADPDVSPRRRRRPARVGAFGRCMAALRAVRPGRTRARRRRVRPAVPRHLHRHADAVRRVRREPGRRRPRRPPRPRRRLAARR